MKDNKKYATLFGGGLKDTESIEYKETILIGKLLSEKGYIIKNGGYSGLMEAVSRGANENNGYVIGYTCKTFRSTKGNEYLNENIPCNDLYDRLRCLLTGSEVYIVQRGGLGTLSEIITLLDEVRKIKNPPKIYILGSAWKTIFDSLKIIMSEKEQELVIFCDNYEEFEKQFQNL